ncbi:MAG: S-methyl-5-thioribose-1-phosphate isomerase [Methanobacteriota archaeon]|nr:MAG: S-methyl-5-thioribose-1-phosphate isomerase [Euryarchaeota archaeon]
MRVKTENDVVDIRAIWWENDSARAIDQRRLPHDFEVVTISTHDQMAEAISNMTVRGAPTIGAAGAYGMALAQKNGVDLDDAASALRATRPTANDLFHAIDAMLSEDDVRRAADSYADMIVAQCERIGKVGADLIDNEMKVLTHCNAGALATVDFGTALAPIRVAHRSGKKPFIFIDETRPRLQGAKLTAWELANEGIEHAIITDNAAGYYLKSEVEIVVVGADRIAANGDFANKIGTYEKAVVAKENGVPFYVAAPISTFDPFMASGDAIVIEQRTPNEVLFINSFRVAADGSRALNPSFDVTPAKFVTGFITEQGVLSADDLKGYIAGQEK